MAKPFKYAKPWTPYERRRCKKCGRMVRVTSRGALYRHRVDPGLWKRCSGGGPRAPRPKPTKGPRPDLALNTPDSAAAWLALIDESRALARLVPSPKLAGLRAQFTRPPPVPHLYRESDFRTELQALLDLHTTAALFASSRWPYRTFAVDAAVLAERLGEHLAHFIKRWAPVPK